MPKITDPDLLIVGTNIAVDTVLREIELTVGGSLIAKDGVTLQALYTKLVELWTTATYNKFPFPMYAIDARSGQFQVGTDGSRFNSWKFKNNTTRQMVRDAGWSEFTPTTPDVAGTSAAGTLARQYAGIVALASGFPAASQFYYQLTAAGAAVNFTFTDAPNEGIQVFGDATNGNFDSRTFFKMFCREYNFTYDDAVLGDVGETGTGAFKVSLPISVSSDLKVQANDAAMSGAPYVGIIAEYFATNQNRTIGGTAYPFRVIVNGNNATLEQIYTKLQYLLRQNTDIDSGAGTVTGKTANQLAYFVGDTLYTTQGVFIDNIQAADLNRVVFLDQNSAQRSFPFSSAGFLNFNSFLQGASSYYRMFFKTLPGASNDYGEASAVTVNDKDGNPIAGAIGAAQVAFTFDYDGNVQGTRTAGTDAAIVLVAGRPGFAKPVVVEGTINRAKGIAFSAVAEQDRAYLNP